MNKIMSLSPEKVNKIAASIDMSEKSESTPMTSDAEDILELED